MAALDLNLTVNVKGAGELAELICALVDFRAVLPAKVIEAMDKLEASVDDGSIAFDQIVTIGQIEIGSAGVDAEAIVKAIADVHLKSGSEHGR
jgi:hypothetical protein